MKIKHKFQHVEGNFDTDKGKLTCTHYSKYNEALLCFKANMNIPFATIKLYSSDLWVDAKETFDDAGNLGDEIVKRWNEYSALKKLADLTAKIFQEINNGNDITIKEFGEVEKALKECNLI